MEMGPANAPSAKPGLLQGLKNLLIPDSGKEGWRSLDLKGISGLLLGPRDPLAPGASAESGRLLGRRGAIDNRFYDSLSASIAKLRLSSPFGDTGLQQQQPLAASLKDSPLHLKSTPRQTVSEQVKNDPILRSDQRVREQQAIHQPQHQEQQSHGLREIPVYDAQGRIVSGAHRSSIRSSLIRAILDTLELVLTGIGFLLLLPLLALRRGWRLVQREPHDEPPKPGAGMASR